MEPSAWYRAEGRIEKEHLMIEFQFSARANFAWDDLDPNASTSFVIPLATTTHGHEKRLNLDPPQGTCATLNIALLELICRAFRARDELLEMSDENVATMPVRQLRHMERTARLSYLAPDIVLAILDGKQPAHLSARQLVRASSLPLDWVGQRRLLLKAA